MQQCWKTAARLHKQHAARALADASSWAQAAPQATATAQSCSSCVVRADTCALLASLVCRPRASSLKLGACRQTSFTVCVTPVARPATCNSTVAFQQHLAGRVVRTDPCALLDSLVCRPRASSLKPGACRQTSFTVCVTPAARPATCILNRHFSISTALCRPRASSLKLCACRRRSSPVCFAPLPGRCG